MQISARAEALLQDLARFHKLPSLAFDSEGWIGMSIDGQVLRLTYSPANDTIFMVTALGSPPVGKDFDPWLGFELSKRFESRRTRVAFLPDLGELALVGEVFLPRLTVDRLNESLVAFVEDCRLTTAVLFEGAALDGTPSPLKGLQEADVGGDMMLVRI